PARRGGADRRLDHPAQRRQGGVPGPDGHATYGAPGRPRRWGSERGRAAARRRSGAQAAVRERARRWTLARAGAGQLRSRAQPERHGSGRRAHRAVQRADKPGGDILLPDGRNGRSRIMIRAYWSEWWKIRRPGMILGGAGTMVGFAVLAVVLMLSRLDRARGGPGADVLTAAQLATSNGFATLITISATFMGVIALAICAVAVGMEYSTGSLRNLLVRQPARLRLLAGKLLALGSFIALAVVLAYGSALATALLLAPGH